MNYFARMGREIRAMFQEQPTEPVEREPITLNDEEMKDLALDLQHATIHYLDNRCLSCMRVEATEADEAYFDEIDPKHKLPLAATDHLCWDKLYGTVCQADLPEDIDEIEAASRVEIMSILKVLRQNKVIA